MDALIDEVTRLPGQPGTVVALRLFGAAILCAFIGLEREFRERSAGLRTNMLVGLAAATFAILSEGVIDQSSQSTVVRADPTRLIEAVTSGVAFLAAGLIIVTKGHVKGLTTGATIWLAAAVGLAIGLGQWLTGILACVAGLFVLLAVRRLEQVMGTKGPR